MEKYALHPGFITSVSDGGRHFISGAQLARLYGLRYGEYRIWDDRNLRVSHGHGETFKHLGPQAHKEEYGRIKKLIAEERNG